MHVQYGPVHLNQCKLQHWSSESVYHHGTFLYERVRFAVRATFNPALQADQLKGRPRSAPVAPGAPVDFSKPSPALGGEGPLVGVRGGPGQPVDGFPANYTVDAVKAALMQPRLFLQAHFLGQPVLLCPLPGMSADSSGEGPKPVSCEVVATDGARTWDVDWTVECCINQHARFSPRPCPILSNAWTATSSVDEDFYETRTYEGEVILDGALVRSPGIYGQGELRPDDLRALFVPPPEAGYKRMSVSTSLLPDGVTVKYRVEDRELAVSFSDPLNRITRVEATHTISLGPEDSVAPLASLLTSMTEASKGGSGGLLGMLQSIVGITSTRESEWRAWNVRNQWVSGPMGMQANRNMALSTHEVNVSVFGNKNTNRKYLEDAAREIMTKRLQPLFDKYHVFLLNSASTYDIANTVVRCSCKFMAPNIPGANKHDPLPMNTEARRYRIEARDDTNSTLPWLVVDADGPTPPGDGVARGTGLTALVAQALSSPYRPAAAFAPEIPADYDESVAARAAPGTRPAWPRPAPSNG